MIRRDPLLVPGSLGQQKVHPAVTEVRAQRLLLAGLLKQLSLPDPATVAGSSNGTRSTKARTAAMTRWTTTGTRN